MTPSPISSGTLSPTATSCGSRYPRIRHVPDYDSSTGEQAIALGEHAGLRLDDWQGDWLIDACGRRADGKWSAKTVGASVSRQNGKGGVLEIRELAGAVLWGEKTIIHSAHEQSTSSEHFLRLMNLIEGSPLLRKRLDRPIRGKGSEAILFRNGARILFKTRAGGSARGFTGDLVVLDEAMILAQVFMGNLIPTTSARSIIGNPQRWYTGSAVDQLVHPHGIAFARQRERGLRGDPAVAWFEWSAPGDDPGTVPDEVLRDPEMWAMANPAMGIRISAEHIASELDEMGARTFAVERLGIGDWPETDPNAGQLINPDLWRSLMDVDSRPDDPVCFSYDVRQDRSMAAVAVAGRRADGLPHVEIDRHEPGTGWVVDDLVGKLERHPSAKLIADSVGPSGSLLPELEQRGITVGRDGNARCRVVTANEHAQACGIFYDAVQQKRLRHLGTEEMSSALRGAAARPLGEAWAWSRKTSAVDISPLVASTLALWGVESMKRTAQPFVAWVGR